LSNLLNNAYEACANNVGRPPHICVSLEESDTNAGRRVICIIRDNGCGIDPEAQDQLGQFGFTTKPDGHGLGLNISANLVEKMGGSFHLKNNCDREDLHDEPGEKCGVSAIIKFPAFEKDDSKL